MPEICGLCPSFPSRYHFRANQQQPAMLDTYIYVHTLHVKEIFPSFICWLLYIYFNIESAQEQIFGWIQIPDLILEHLCHQLRLGVVKEGLGGPGLC